MKVLFLYYFLNKYFFSNYSKIFRIITGFIINFFYIIEYIFIFILNINFFYFLILYKYFLKEKYVFNKKAEDVPTFKEKKKEVKKKIKKSDIILARFDFYRRKFWYMYYRRWMYWGLNVVRVQLFIWTLKHRRYRSLDFVRDKIIWRLQKLKKKILRGFSYLYFFSVYNIARILFNLENGIIYTLFFLWSLIRFICFFFFVNTIFACWKIKALIIYIQIKIFKKW